MSDSPIKKRLRRAKDQAQADLAGRYTVIVSDNDPVCLVAYRDREFRIIRICLDQASKADRAALGRCARADGASRELWIREHGAIRFRVEFL